MPINVLPPPGAKRHANLSILLQVTDSRSHHNKKLSESRGKDCILNPIWQAKFRLMLFVPSLFAARGTQSCSESFATQKSPITIAQHKAIAEWLCATSERAIPMRKRRRAVLPTRAAVC